MLVRLKRPVTGWVPRPAGQQNGNLGKRWRLRRQQSRSGQQPSRGRVVIDTVLAQLDTLDPCQHLTTLDDMRYWIATDPGRVLCEFCWGAVQVLGDERQLACEFCGRPVTDPGGANAVVLAKAAPGFGVHFWLCCTCTSADKTEGMA